jgi:hypothetical protein
MRLRTEGKRPRCYAGGETGAIPVSVIEHVAVEQYDLLTPPAFRRYPRVS